MNKYCNKRERIIMNINIKKKHLKSCTDKYYNY